MEKVILKRYEKMYLLVLISLFLIRSVHYFNHFDLPISDFLALKDNAIRLFQLRFPKELTRGPLYPLLIGVGSFLPSKQAILFLAEIINVIFATFSVFMMFQISKNLRFNYPIAVPLLFGLYPITTFLTSQPLIEISLVFCILFTIYLDLINSNWAFFVAGLTCLIRWDGILLVFFLFLKKLIYYRKKVKFLIFSAFSIFPILIWFLIPFFKKKLSATRYLSAFIRFLTFNLSGINLYNYFNQLRHMLLISWFWKIPRLTELILLGIILFIIFWGILKVLKKDFKKAFLISCFFISYIYFLLIISPKGSLEPRNIFIVLWVILIFFWYGIENLLGLLRKELNHRMWNKKTINVFILLIIFLLTGAISFSCIKATRKVMDDPQYHWEELVLLAKWYETNARQGDRLFMSHPHTIMDITNLPDRYFVDSYSMRKSNISDLLKEMKNRRVTYVVYVNRYNAEEWATSLLNDYFRRDNFFIKGNHFQLVKKIEVEPRGWKYVKIYRVNMPNKY